MSAPAESSRGLAFRAEQIWRDGALRSMPLWLVVTGLNTSVLIGALAFRAARDSSVPEPTAVATVFWLVLAVFLGACRGRARCSEMDLALPMSSRELWVGHLVATVLAGLVALAVSVGVVVAHEALLDKSIGWQGVVPPLVAGLVFVAVTLQSYQRDLRMPPRGRFNLVLLAALIVVLIVVWTLIDHPWLAAGLLLVLSSLVGVRTYRALAPGFVTVPRQPLKGEPTSVGTRDHARTPSRGSIWRTLFVIFHHAPPWGAAMPWFLYTFIVVIGFVMAGGLGLFSTFYDDRVLRFIYLPLASYGLFTGIGVLLYQNFRVEPLPVSRARLFALLMLPTLAFFLVGFAGTRVVLLAQSPPQIVNYQIRGEHYWVDVPVRYLSVSRSGQVPTIEAPWGESHPAWSTPLLGEGGDTVLYSEFNTSEKSSARFEALLLSRAVEELYGRAIPADQLLDRYFVVENDRPVGFKGGSFTLHDDYSDLVGPDDGPESPVYLAIIVVPWLLVTTIFFRAFRAPSSERRLKAAYWTIMGLLLSGVLVQAMGMVFGFFDAEVASAILATWIRQLGESPLTIAASWLVAVSMISICYWLALGQYKRAEFPARPIKLSLIDFAPGSS